MLTCSRCYRYKALQPPKTNCEACWSKFFRANVGRFRACIQAMNAVGKERVAEKLGTKFMHQLKKFQERHNVG